MNKKVTYSKPALEALNEKYKGATIGIKNGKKFTKFKK